MVHFSVTRVRGSGPYDLDACGDILAIARAVGVMAEDTYADRRNITQCDGDGYRGKRYVSSGTRYRKSWRSSWAPCQMKRPRLTPRGETAVQVRADIGSAPAIGTQGGHHG